MRGVTHSLRISRARLPAGTGTATIEDSLLEFSGQRGGHQTVLVLGQRLSRRIRSRGTPTSQPLCKGSVANW